MTGDQVQGAVDNMQYLLPFGNRGASGGALRWLACGDWRISTQVGVDLVERQLASGEGFVVGRTQWTISRKALLVGHGIEGQSLEEE